MTIATPTYQFARGERIAIPLMAHGDRTGVTSIVAEMRFAQFLPRAIEPGLPLSGTFDIREIDVGWVLLIEDTTGLAPGYHVADACLTVATARIITDPIIILITEPSTEAI